MKAELPTPIDFDRQLADELRSVAAGRKAVNLDSAAVAPGDPPIKQAHDSGLLGLAFSGGGIRSATFNLGVLQGLSELDILSRVDYLSTVSGGGYIGSWLSAWIHRERDQGGVTEVERQLGVIEPRERRHQLATADQPHVGHEPSAVSWLRRYSNYLTPRVGFSTDTLAGIAGFLRNLLLNQTILIAAAAALLLLIWTLLIVAAQPGFAGPPSCLLVGSVLFGLATLIGGFETARVELGMAGSMSRGNSLAMACTSFICVAAFLFGIATSSTWFEAQQGPMLDPFQVRLGIIPDSWLRFTYLGAAIGIGLLYTVSITAGWVIGAVHFGKLKRKAEKPSAPLQGGPGLAGFLRRHGYPFLGAVLGGFLFGCFLLLWFHLSLNVRPILREPMQNTVLAPVALLTMWLLAAVFHLGVVGRGFREAAREWCGRLGAQVLWVILIWLSVSAITLYGPYLWHELDGRINALGGITWVVTSLAGVYMALSSNTDGDASKSWKDLLAKVAPHVFIAGLLVSLSYGVYRVALVTGGYSGDPHGEVCRKKDETRPGKLLYDVAGTIAPDGRTDMTVREAEATSGCKFKIYSEFVVAQAVAAGPLLLVLASGLGFAVLFLSARVDINVFSFHGFYRNRLERCYLGASNRRRKPHPYTGLDPDDSPRLAEMTITGDDTESLAQRPLHVINTAINLTRGTELAWQERQAASFTFTPMYCGYSLPGPGQTEKSWYQSTREFLDGRGWISLGMPMTVSGAAASPNWGYHTNPWTAFLMTLFNVRLGWWMQNSRWTKVWRTRGPEFGLPLLLSELLGVASDNRDYVYLSDGGHFENLGIYELVRRRCRYIVACDAGCDPDYKFEDLGNAIRKCRVDFGIDIRIDPRVIIPEQGKRTSKRRYAVGEIHYERVDESAPIGYLVYFKPTLTGRESADVLQYASQFADFPHQSTLDQWFNESQFESYRKLGYDTVHEALGPESELGAAGGLKGGPAGHPPAEDALQSLVSTTEDSALDALFGRTGGSEGTPQPAT